MGLKHYRTVTFVDKAHGESYDKENKRIGGKIVDKKAYSRPIITKSISDQLEGVFACNGQIEGSNQGGEKGDNPGGGKGGKFKPGQWKCN